MSPPVTRDRLNPKDIAANATAAGRFHDVVISASRALHEQELRPKDRDSLEWARKVLQSAGEGMVGAMPAAKALVGSADPILVIRKAALSSANDDLDSRLRGLSKDIPKILAGGRSDHLIQSLESLRTIFSMVSRMSLNTEVVAESSHADGSWPPSMTTLLS